MTASQKQQITSMRYARLSYADISAKTGISVNTVKTFCRRNCLTDAELAEQSICMNCGCSITNGKYRPKKFCSDKCRMAWWNIHQDQVNRNAHYSFTCAHCGESFTVYGNAHRKFCSRACYLASRSKAVISR